MGWLWTIQSGPGSRCGGHGDGDVIGVEVGEVEDADGDRLGDDGLGYRGEPGVAGRLWDAVDDMLALGLAG
jgi:hypothetical protein